MRKPFNTPKPFGILLPATQAPANPPFVNWFPAEGAARYRVTFAGRGEPQTWETPYNFLTPPVPLEAGLFSITVEAIGSDGALIATDERQTQLEPPATGTSADLNNLHRAPGSRLFLQDADVRSILAAEGERGEWRDRLLAVADDISEELLQGPPEPESYPNGVWSFDYWKKNNSVCIALEDAIFAATVAWRLTGDDKYLAPAIRMLSHAAQWDPLGPTGLWENDHSTHAFLHAFTVAYDTFGEALPADLRSAIRASIAARCRDIYEFLNPFHMKELSCGLMGSPANNHAWFVAEAMGLGGLALWEEEPDARQWVALAAQLHTGAFFPFGDPDGGWHEGIDYWSYSLFFTFQFLDALLDATGVNLYEHPWLRKTTSFKMLAHPPAGAYVPFGDVKHHPPLAVDRLIAMRLASRHHDPGEWRYVDTIAGGAIDQRRHLPHALAWSDRGGVTREAAAVAVPARVAHYKDMGWVVVNSDPFHADDQVLFAFKSGGKHPGASGHCHADVNSFVLCVGGEKLLWDAGYYDSYESPHHSGYSRQSQAHNVLLVDGAGQLGKTRGVYGHISRCDVDGLNVAVESDASHPLVYGGLVDRFVRRASLRDCAELIVEDEIVTPHAARLSLLLHSVYPILWDPGEKTLCIRGERIELLGRLETDQPIDATITTAFEYVCNTRSALLDTFDDYPDQYHLEMKTARAVREWNPCMVFTWNGIR
ncbi:MAG TPA: DUF4962 domain-containing protein [Armatimonadota bacterium]|jgi:hypothetical protein